MHPKEQIQVRLHRTLWLWRDLQAKMRALQTRSQFAESPLPGFFPARCVFKEHPYQWLFNPNSNEMVWSYYCPPSSLAFRELLVGVIFCFSSSFSPENSGLLFWSWSLTMFLLSTAFPQFPHPSAALEPRAMFSACQSDASGWGCGGRGEESQPEVLSPQQTFRYWSVMALQSTGSHRHTRLARTTRIPVTPPCSSSNILLPFYHLPFTGCSEKSQRVRRRRSLVVPSFGISETWFWLSPVIRRLGAT